MTEVAIGRGERGAFGAAARRWGGRVLAGLLALCLAIDAALELANDIWARQAAALICWPAALDLPRGAIELIGLVLFLIPCSSCLGAIYLTGRLRRRGPPTRGKTIDASARRCSASTSASRNGAPSGCAMRA